MKDNIELGKRPESASQWITKMGNYGSLPEPFQEVSLDDYIHMSSCYAPQGIEHRQISVICQGRDVYRSVRIEWYHNCAFAVVYPDRWRCGKENEPQIVYEEPVKYYRLGCQHKWKELSQKECHERGIEHCGNCWHVIECEHCHYIESYDSSG